SVDRPGQYVARVSLRIPGGNSWSAGRHRHRRGYRNSVLAGRRTSWRDGRSGPATAAAGRLVAGYCFLFLRTLLFFQDAYVEREAQTRSIGKFKYYFKLSRNVLPRLLFPFFLNFKFFFNYRLRGS